MSGSIGCLSVLSSGRNFMWYFSYFALLLQRSNTWTSWFVVELPVGLLSMAWAVLAECQASWEFTGIKSSPWRERWLTGIFTQNPLLRSQTNIRWSAEFAKYLFCVCFDPQLRYCDIGVFLRKFRCPTVPLSFLNKKRNSNLTSR